MGCYLVFYNNTVLEVSDTWEGEGTHVLDGGEVDVGVLVGFDLRNGKHISGFRLPVG
jgi:hypothetical protein